MDAIVVSNLSKSFKKTRSRAEYTSLKTEFVRWIRGQRPKAESRLIEVLEDLSFKVPKGKTVGIIGRNGSGKSTLLKLITGIYTPTGGSITVNGRVSALLELGAGFHPDFTGRENILINGIILGMSREEVVRRTPEIIAFSELGEFVDQPVRTYSSGMFMRLAFAVAVHVDPEILIVDEILAVGDEHFSRKSRAKMDEFRAQGKTLLMVTHDLDAIQGWCDEAIWLDGGRIRQTGDPHHVVQAYKKAVALAETQQESGEASALSAPNLALPEAKRAALPRFGPQAGPDHRWGDFRAELTGVRICAPDGVETGSFDPEAGMVLEVAFVTHEALEDIGFGITFRSTQGALVYDTSTFAERVPLPSPFPSSGLLTFSIPRLGLVAGGYRVDVSLRARGGHEYDAHCGLYGFTVQSQVGEGGIARVPHTWAFQADPGDSKLAEAVSGG